MSISIPHGLRSEKDEEDSCALTFYTRQLRQPVGTAGLRSRVDALRQIHMPEEARPGPRISRVSFQCVPSIDGTMQQEVEVLCKVGKAVVTGVKEGCKTTVHTVQEIVNHPVDTAAAIGGLIHDTATSVGAQLVPCPALWDPSAQQRTAQRIENLISAYDGYAQASPCKKIETLSHLGTVFFLPGGIIKTGKMAWSAATINDIAQIQRPALAVCMASNTTRATPVQPPVFFAASLIKPTSHLEAAIEKSRDILHRLSEKLPAIRLSEELPGNMKAFIDASRQLLLQGTAETLTGRSIAIAGSVRFVAVDSKVMYLVDNTIWWSRRHQLLHLNHSDRLALALKEIAEFSKTRNYTEVYFIHRQRVPLLATLMDQRYPIQAVGEFLAGMAAGYRQPLSILQVKGRSTLVLESPVFEPTMRQGVLPLRLVNKPPIVPVVHEPFWFPKRADVYWVDFGKINGGNTGKVRPALVISSSKFNKNGSVSTVAPIVTTRAGAKKFPFEVQTNVAGRKGSIKLNQCQTIDTSKILGKITQLSESQMQLVNEALKKTLAIE